MPYRATVTCAECGFEFEARSPRAKFCPEPKCRKAASRRPSKQGAAEAATTDAASPANPPARGGLVSQVAADLMKAGVLDTIPGRGALALAYRIESPMETGSAAASMTRELSRLVAEAMELQPKTQDAVDDIGDSVSVKLRLVQ